MFNTLQNTFLDFFGEQNDIKEMSAREFYNSLDKNSLNNIIVTYNIKLMQYFITMNWSFKDYLFGGLSNFKYITLKKSILIYMVIMSQMKFQKNIMNLLVNII